MSREMLVDIISAETGCTKKDGARVVEAIIAEIAQTLVTSGTFRLSGFGTFERRDRAARTARNPRTGEEVPVPAGYRLTFRASSALKAAMAIMPPSRPDP